MATTFPVSNVAVATEPPQMRPLAERTHALGARDAVYASGPASIVEGPSISPLVHAAHVAFAEHRPLVLAPDDVWFVVLSAVARHVGANAESLRDRFVTHEGRGTIEVRRDDLAPACDPPGDWSTVPAALCEEVLARLTPQGSALRLSFTTTDGPSRAAMDVALLEAMQSYFSYSVGSLCGIPEVTLLGVPDDWSAILARTAALEELGLERWLGPLREVLRAFHRASMGDADPRFWSAFYKPEHFSGGDLVTGWINVFYPYLGEGAALRDVAPYLPRNMPTLDPEASWLGDEMAPKADAFPLGLAKAPFVWRLLASEHPMELVSGHVGVGFDGRAVRPRFGGWVAPARREPRLFRIHNPSPRGALLLPLQVDRLHTLSTIAAEAEGYPSVAVMLGRCSALRSLEGIEKLATLERISVSDCDGITSLAPLAGLPRVREISFMQCQGLADLSALATLPSLEELSVMRCPAARGIAAIKHLPALRRVTLWGCEEVPERFRKQITDRAEILALQAWLS